METQRPEYFGQKAESSGEEDGSRGDYPHSRSWRGGNPKEKLREKSKQSIRDFWGLRTPITSEISRESARRISKLSSISTPNSTTLRCEKKIYTSLEELQTDVDIWLRHYNHERPHSRKYCLDKTPMQTFNEGKHTAIDKSNQLAYYISSVRFFHHSKIIHGRKRISLRHMYVF